jgi:uncharacterized DUF497 family protein
MKIKGIVWLEQVIEKLERKHGVSQNEVREVFANSPHFRFVEKGYRRGEDVYSALGRTDSGRRLIVFFVRKSGGRALIVSARPMSDSERRMYGQR